MAKVILSAAMILATMAQAGSVLADGADDVPETADVVPADQQTEVELAPEPEIYSYRQLVRLTYYVEYGLTASGRMTAPGTTACSYNFSFGTRFVLPDGETVTCIDRGKLGSTGWLDLWRRPDLANGYGPYATVEVIP